QTQTLYYLGQVGDPVYAVAAGQVVYANTTSSNSGLARYGHLIMIQHANDYVSVYAHNNRILVAQGERVQAGQRIGELGTSGQAPQQASVGIQIRQYAKNIDPRQLLPR
ncbi:MAG: M23 family metallopeptidase, partial [Acinetobacter sp.]|nr:M23 family metallopeptidase [Acinetobacter sp.]